MSALSCGYEFDVRIKLDGVSYTRRVYALSEEDARNYVNASFKERPYPQTIENVTMTGKERHDGFVTKLAARK